MIHPDPEKLLEDQGAQILLRLLLWGEARGERDAGGDLDARGMLGVAWVAMNRSKDRSMTLPEVILQPWQFSCFNANDPNRASMLKAHELEPVAWSRADAVADLVEASLTIDPTKGASHYVVEALWGRSGTAKWFGKIEIDAGRTVELARIGHHVFARAA
ncbi:MAG: hypothetical protein RI885_2256 [Actinomycetota bacterium]